VINVSPSIHSSQKYLVVDDHAAFRQTVKDFLPGNPVQVIECDDGVEAVAIYPELQPDWALMDIQMPGMDGLKATRLICSENPKARIIILSQHDSPDLREAALEAGALAYIQKDRLKDLPGIIASFLPDGPPNQTPDAIS